MALLYWNCQLTLFIALRICKTIFIVRCSTLICGPWSPYNNFTQEEWWILVAVCETIRHLVCIVCRLVVRKDLADLFLSVGVGVIGGLEAAIHSFRYCYNKCAVKIDMHNAFTKCILSGLSLVESPSTYLKFIVGVISIHLICKMDLLAFKCTRGV